jgi:hypothetical protein
MRINPNQQLAVQTTLDALMGRREFDRLCTGMRVHMDNGILYVFVSTKTARRKWKLVFQMIWRWRLNRFLVNLCAQ